MHFYLITLKRKKKLNKVNIKKKQDKNLIYNLQHSFTKFKDIDEFKELSLDSMYKKLNNFKKRFNNLKTVDPQTNEIKALKPKVLDNVGVFLMNYITFTKINTMKKKMS